MTRAELLALILGSAGFGALISSVVSGVAAYLMKKPDLQRQDEHFALKLTQMKHEQLMAAQEWSIKTEGQPRPIDLWDPLVSAIDYLRGIQEFRKTGTWEKGEAGHLTR
jgi:hypothetical protein